MNYYLPDGYIKRKDNLAYIDEPGNFNYQPYVYSFSEHIASRAGLEWIIDIGCGSAGKLISLSEKFSIVGIDSPEGIGFAREAIPNSRLIVHNLETGLPKLSANILSRALIICSDVLEHLRNPEVLMGSLAELSRKAPYVVISTPDRDRARGWLDNGPPQNPAHVMEWNGTEFVRFMRGSGFDQIPFHGHTINTDFHRAKSTLLAVSGTHATVDHSAPLKRVAAIIHGFNEADILPEVFQHLAAQGVDVHYFDNWSTDGSWELSREFKRTGRIAHCERFPEKPTNQYQWHTQLSKTADYARSLDADWVLHHDADEIRISPWEGVTLREAISSIDSVGYNAIDFTVIDFRFLRSSPNASAPFQNNLWHFEFGRRPGHFAQVKGWKNVRSVNLAESGGHDAVFEGRKVYPMKFLLKHYPLRNKEQAGKKIHQNRLPRYILEKGKYGWHTQYDQFSDSKEVSGWKYSDLLPWHPVHFNTEYVVERLSGIGLSD